MQPKGRKNPKYGVQKWILYYIRNVGKSPEAKKIISSMNRNWAKKEVRQGLEDHEESKHTQS